MYQKENNDNLLFKDVLLTNNTKSTIDNSTIHVDELIITHKWFNEYKEKVFVDYIENKIEELAAKEKIRIFPVLFDELNKNVQIEKDKAVGIFFYFENRKVISYESLENEYKKLNKPVPISKVFPRIEMSEKGNVFTLLHELGHYFIYKRNQVQSEKAANLFIEEFFDNYLPPFFKWIYQIEIKIRGNMDLKFTLEECKEYWEKYCEFKNNFEK